MVKLYKPYLLILLLFAFFIRIINLSHPSSYIYDEVYHVVTVKAHAQNNPAGYEWWHSPPEPNTAYDWLHPPLAKLIQAASVRIIGDNSFAWRFPSALFGTLSVFALYYLTLTVTKNKTTALFAAAIFSFDNLQLTMSRITMNDIFVTTWIIFALAFFYRFISKKSFNRVNKSLYRLLFFTGLFTGLALATKHSAILLYPVFAVFIVKKNLFSLKQFFSLLPDLIIFLGVLPLLVYLLSYSQFFLQHHTFEQFIELHQQIYWYQTNLSATHSYQSSAWQWPFLIRPVWFYVKYSTDHIANIYNLGNPMVFWGGFVAVLYTLFQTSKKQGLKTLFPLTSYFFLFFPFAFSPRIMFLHHYLPAVPLLCLVTAQTISRHYRLALSYLLVTFCLFVFFLPLNLAIPLPENLLKLWFWLPTWR